MKKVIAFLVPFLIGCGLCVLCIVSNGSVETRVAFGAGCVLMGITIGGFLVGILLRDEAEKERFYSQKKAPDKE